MKFSLRVCLSIGLAVHITSAAFAYSFNAFNGMTGKGAVSLSPSVSIPFSPEFGTAVDLIGSYGFTPNFDLFIDAADFNIAPEPGYAYSWIMPRFEFLPNNIIALQFQLNNADPLTYSVSPQYHYFYENDSVAFEINGNIALPVNNPDALISAGGTIAPVWKAVKGTLYPFIEIDPSYSFGDGGGFNLNIVPGIWLGIPDTPHQFCLALTLSGVTSGSLGYSVNFWYSVSFSAVTEPAKNDKE